MCVGVCGLGCMPVFGDGGYLLANQIQILPNLGVGASFVFCEVVWSDFVCESVLEGCGKRKNVPVPEFVCVKGLCLLARQVFCELTLCGRHS